MKIVPFPQSEGAPDEQTLAEIEAALRAPDDGRDSGGATTAERASAAHWRQLRSDVRSIVPPVSEEFARQLRERIEAREAKPSRRFAPRASARSWVARRRAWLGSGMRARVLALGGICAMVAIVTLVIAAPWRQDMLAEPTFSHSVEAERGSPDAARGPVRGAAKQAAPVKSASRAGDNDQLSAGAVSGAGSSVATGETQPSRVQQHAAALTLAPKPEAVQSVTDQIAQLAVREGGFVQSSQVRLQSGAGGSAELRLSLPSARLSAALAALGRLAPMRAESQSLQDITDEYAAAQRKLSDAVAERQALLRALSRASTQGQIESLHARIALAAASVTRARTAFEAISRRGSSSTVEVTVAGDAHAATERSTLGSGLHDALDVLKGVAVVLLVALAVLLPLALLLALVGLAWQTWRRRLRERALS
ncbi:MAG: hypothetical protein JWM66_912 [Solirubrobacterales bacterium]|nr:hypothetical protein [Solirubrobacterales bacterium]